MVSAKGQVDQTDRERERDFENNRVGTVRPWHDDVQNNLAASRVIRNDGHGSSCISPDRRLVEKSRVDGHRSRRHEKNAISLLFVACPQRYACTSVRSTAGLGGSVKWCVDADGSL